MFITVHCIVMVIIIDKFRLDYRASHTVENDMELGYSASSYTLQTFLRNFEPSPACMEKLSGP